MTKINDDPPQHDISVETVKSPTSDCECPFVPHGKSQYQIPLHDWTTDINTWSIEQSRCNSGQLYREHPPRISSIEPTPYSNIPRNGGTARTVFECPTKVLAKNAFRCGFLVWCVCQNLFRCIADSMCHLSVTRASDACIACKVIRKINDGDEKSFKCKYWYVHLYRVAFAGLLIALLVSNAISDTSMSRKDNMTMHERRHFCISWSAGYSLLCCNDAYGRIVKHGFLAISYKKTETTLFLLSDTSRGLGLVILSYPCHALGIAFACWSISKNPLYTVSHTIIQLRICLVTALTHPVAEPIRFPSRSRKNLSVRCSRGHGYQQAVPQARGLSIT